MTLVELKKLQSSCAHQWMTIGIINGKQSAVMCKLCCKSKRT